ncbi:hypothetical protein Csa_012123 [Cucumis sativus]|nr:hypothetical protein Csa_012123 [Cucumis sativus]
MVHVTRVEGWAWIWLRGVVKRGDGSMKAHVRGGEDWLTWTGDATRNGATAGGWRMAELRRQ